MATLQGLLERLATSGGSIVSSSTLNEHELIAASCCDRMFTDVNGLGFVWVQDDLEDSRELTGIISDEIYTNENRQGLRDEYCLHNGYSHFNDEILNDYTDYLELRMIESLVLMDKCMASRIRID